MWIKISKAAMQPKQIINAIKMDIRSLLSDIRSFDSINSDSVVKASRSFSSVMWMRKVVVKECPFPVVPSDSSKHNSCLYEMS